MYTYGTNAAHDSICIKIHWTNLNDSSYFTSVGLLWIVKFSSDLYANNRCYGSWQLLLSYEFFNIFFFNILTIADH